MTSETNSPEKIIELRLNSFVRRTRDTTTLKVLVNDCGGRLIRKGRSRNWRLFLPFAGRKKLVDALYSADQPSWLWIAKLLSEEKVSYEAKELIALVRDNPSITINDLMAETNCSLLEARQAIDYVEWSD